MRSEPLRAISVKFAHLAFPCGWSPLWSHTPLKMFLHRLIDAHKGVPKLSGVLHQESLVGIMYLGLASSNGVHLCGGLQYISFERTIQSGVALYLDDLAP